LPLLPQRWRPFVMQQVRVRNFISDKVIKEFVWQLQSVYLVFVTLFQLAQR
jgi:hypothetical protein